MSILESSVEHQAVVYSLQLGWPISFKLSPVKSNGFPDRIFINKHGFHLYIEFKKPGETPGKLQLYRINELRACKVAAYWTNQVRQAKELLDVYVDTKRLPDKGDSPLDIPGFSRPASRSRFRKN